MNSENRFKAFTLAEIFIVLAVVGTLFAMTFSLTLGSAKSKAKRLAVAAKTFYSNVETIYPDVLHNYTSGYSLTNIEGTDGTLSEDNKVVAKIFSKYLDGEVLDDCSELEIASGQVVSSYLNENMACARFHTGIIAGFSYNYGCEYSANTASDEETKDDSEEESDLNTLAIFEYPKALEDGEEDEISSKEIQNTCGYIIYGFDGGSGTFGKDLFTIALGKHGVK